MSAQTGDTRQMTLDEFIAKHGLTVEVEAAESNRNMDDMPAGSTHYLVSIQKHGGDFLFVVPFSMGPALQGPPELADVLNCVADDTATVQNAQSFDDWCQELGYFPMESSADMERATRAWQAVNDQADALSALLGDEALEELLYETERQ